MKILVITQKVNSADSVLGFFVEWLNVFSRYFDIVVTICLEKGSFDVSKNVFIYSLGKEASRLKIIYLVNFFSLIIRERRSYDIVFVHMNQEYVILGAIIWKILGKKILFWRNHKDGSLLTTLACLLADQIYYTSKQSFTSRYRHSKQMPVGVAVPDIEKKLAPSRTILSLGRISPIKNIDLLLKSLLVLNQNSIDFRCSIVGDPANDGDGPYGVQIKKEGEGLVSSGLLQFDSGVPYSKVGDLLKSHRFFINITPDGSLDKTMFEAMANGAIVVTSNSFFKGIIPDECFLDELKPEKIAQKIQFLFEIPDDVLLKWQLKNREYIAKDHSIDALVKIIADC